MPLRHQWLLSLAVALLPVTSGFASNTVPLPGVDNAQRARVNYMLNCQGCHGAQGVAIAGASVPAMQNFVGNFLQVDGGRAYIVQVPGSANAAISDAALAELLNWMLPTLSPGQLPKPFTPYTASEITRLRANPLQDVEAERGKLVDRIRSAGIAAP